MNTNCLKCRIIRMRVAAAVFQAAGESLEKLETRFRRRHADISFQIFIRTEFNCTELVASKDGWHFSIAKEKYEPNAR